MTARLPGRSALVTGSTDGLGAGIARALADEGAYVVVSGRHAARGEKVVAEIAERGGSASGPLDILVNNAAMLIAPGPGSRHRRRPDRRRASREREGGHPAHRADRPGHGRPR